MSVRFAPERPEHNDAIERVLDRAFGPGRFAKTSERVRERGAVLDASLSRVALDGENLVGVCRIYHVVAGQPAFFLGPLAVDPGEQHQGLGLSLAREAMIACRDTHSAGAIILVGAEPFFRALNFAPVPPGRVRLPGPVDPRRLLWLELRPHGFDGIEGEVGAPKTE